MEQDFLKAISILGDLFDEILKETETNNIKNRKDTRDNYKNKKINKSKSIKEKVENVLESLVAHNTAGIRLFFDEKKLIVCFLTPGIVSKSVKYQISKNHNSYNKSSHIINITGKYENILKTYFSNEREVFATTDTKIGLPGDNFKASFELDKKDWDFNKIEKRIKNGLVCFIIPVKK